MSKDQRAKSKVIGSLRPQRPHWRFEDLQIWNSACDLAVGFHRIADGLEIISLLGREYQDMCGLTIVLVASAEQKEDAILVVALGAAEERGVARR